jgi:MFS family permease
MTESAQAAAGIPPVPEAMSIGQHVFVSLLWLALFAQWMTVVPIIVPDQVAIIIDRDGAAKEGISGTILGAGALVALVIAPISGALSDRSRAPRGRRRSFLIWGIVGSCISLLLLIPFGPGSNLWLYGAAFLVLQFWWNWVAGAYAGLIPDVVMPSQQGRASAWMNVMTVIGTVIGNLIVAVAYRPGRPEGAIAAFIALNLGALALMIQFVREPRPSGSRPVFVMTEFIRDFYVDPREHANFYWVIITRLFGNMGIWSVFTFLLFYFQDVIGVAEPAKVLPALLGLGAVLAVPASIIGIRLGARLGLVRVTQITSWIMAGCAVCYVLIAFYPSFVLIVPVVLVYAAAYGAYQAVDWALALKVLPSAEAAGKDMGIWHISMVLPQILGPAGTGWLISGVKASYGAPAAYTAAFGIGTLWLVLSAALVTRVRLPVVQAPSVRALP